MLTKQNVNMASRAFQGWTPNEIQPLHAELGAPHLLILVFK